MTDKGNMQGKLGKVACKASTEIGSCAWRLIGRQPANKSRCLDCDHDHDHDDDDDYADGGDDGDDDDDDQRHDGEEVMVVAGMKGGKRNM